MKYTLIALAMLAASAPAIAKPVMHSVALPDGSTIVTVVDANNQVLSPSTSQRITLRCSPTCAVIDSSNNAGGVFGGLLSGAAAAALHRPDRFTTTISTNSAASPSQTANATGGKSDGSTAVAGSASDSGALSGSLSLSDADARGGNATSVSASDAKGGAGGAGGAGGKSCTGIGSC